MTLHVSACRALDYTNDYDKATTVDPVRNKRLRLGPARSMPELRTLMMSKSPRSQLRVPWRNQHDPSVSVSSVASLCSAQLSAGRIA